MKKTVLLFCSLALAQTPPTRVSTSQLRAASATPAPAVYVVDASGVMRFATLGANLQLTCSAGGCVVDALPSPTFPARRVETTVVSVATLDAFTLANPWTIELDVQRNGLELTEGLDYSVAGQTITFVAAARPGAGDVLRFKYR